MVRNKTCRGRALRIAVGITALVLLLAGGAGAATLTVDDSGGANYTSIQDAINAASAGDTILVFNGTYNEHVNITKELILRGMNMPTVDAYGIGSAIIVSANNVTIDGFKAKGSDDYYPNGGISIKSSNNTVKNNSLFSNRKGIFLISPNNKIFDNTIYSNEFGILLEYSNNNTFLNNTIYNNGDGFNLYVSSANNLIQNIMFGNTRGIVFTWGINNTIVSNSFYSNSQGIHFEASSNNIIKENSINNNGYRGIIILSSSNNNNILNNNISINNIGITIQTSLNNKIYHNNLLNNTIQNAYDDSNNSWDNGSAGNYWSDYSGTDINNDGIGDTPYNIDGGSGAQDRYPLMKENGWLPPSGGGGGGGGGRGFDTGAGGYPSIMGTHNGTLRLNQSINMSKMYTYQSPGTGGHSEYAAFYYPDGSLLAEGYWSGYSGDWHNITFAPFTLEANVTYNYTIRTGSYPQIIHANNITNSAGIMTSTEFIDANGKSYKGWIPAIRLEQ